MKNFGFRFLISAFLALVPVVANAQVFGIVNDQPSGFRGKVQAQGAPPTIGAGSTCGTAPALALGSTDWLGEITNGTGSPTSCVLTFASPFNVAPFCKVIPKSAVLAALSWVATATTLTITQTGTSSNVLTYECIAKSGG